MDYILLPLKKCESASVGQPVNLNPPASLNLFKLSLLPLQKSEPPLFCKCPQQRRLRLVQIHGVPPGPVRFAHLLSLENVYGHFLSVRSLGIFTLFERSQYTQLLNQLGFICGCAY